jgi:hypothetical protein
MLLESILFDPELLSSRFLTFYGFVCWGRATQDRLTFGVEVGKIGSIWYMAV